MIEHATTAVDGTVRRLLENDGVYVQLEAGGHRVCFVTGALRESGTVFRIGDRVSVRLPSPASVVAGVLGAEIVARSGAAESHGGRRSLVAGPAAGVGKPAAQRIDRSARPGWATGHERLPSVGEAVYCTAGPASVVRVHGKTGDGSRLLELRLASGAREPFFAAGSNVLVAAPGEPEAGACAEAEPSGASSR
ncbi:MAG TPA: hypothetical protein VFQ38_07010 [Longimicrobiales bacterium]|nr:hypothetical protein [Longimicrobiales bacterium]